MPIQTSDEQADSLLWKIVLPSRLGQSLGPEVLGRPYVIHPWVAYVEQEVMAMLKRPGREVLIVNLPPQSGKTTYFGMWLPFWYIGMNPDNNMILVGYCLAPETPVLTENLEWVPVGNLGIGDRLVGFDEQAGVGGGHCRQWRSSTVTKTGRAVLPCYRVTLADGTQTVCSEQHKWLVTTRTDARHARWVSAVDLMERKRWKRELPYAVKLFEPWSSTEGREAGYLAGLLDGEGWIGPANKPGTRVSMAQRPGRVLDQAERAVKSLGFSCSVRDEGVVNRLDITGGTSETLRLLGSVRPERLIDNWRAQGGADGMGKLKKLDRVAIVDIEFVGEREVVTLSTSTGTLVADGFAHHNSDEYVGGWGKLVRNLVDRYGQEMYGVGLDPSAQAINLWKTTRGVGGMLSAGIFGGITGNPGHLIFIDDVIKNMEEAGSPTTKRKHLEEWDGSISARFQEDTKVIIPSTRWAEDDLSGEIWRRSLEPGYDGIPVKRINIRAIAEPEEGEEGGPDWRDFLGRKEGEALKGQHSAEFFREKQASISAFVWSALYQGEPSAREGSMFPPDNWGWYDPDTRPDMIELRRGWDIAATEDDGDWTVGAKVGKARDGRIYILDLRRFRKSTSGVKDEVLRCAELDGKVTPIRMEQERAGAGKSVVEGYEDDLAGYDFEGMRPDGSKVSRFTNYSDLQQRGHVLLPRRVVDGEEVKPDWVAEFVKEHKMMYDEKRKPRHDDQIDAVAMCVNDIYGSQVIEIRDPVVTASVSGSEAMHDFLAAQGVTAEPAMPDRLSRLLGRHVGA